MERLSGLDASFLYLETSSQVMNVAAILQVDPTTIPGGYSFEKLRAEMARRVKGMPVLRRKIADSLTNVDHPVWQEDADFDIERHVHRIAIPSPGRIDEVAQMCSHLVGQVLDRKKPLWDLWVMEGMEGGRIALMLRMHHASVDGATVADILGQLATATPDPPPLDPDLVAISAGAAPRAEMAVGGALNFFMQRPIAALKLIPKTLPVPVEWVKRVRSGDGMPAPFLAPRTRFNAPLTPRRAIALTQLPLADVKRVKNHYGVKMNDVVLAMTGGALRDYLVVRDELPEGPLVGMVPVSVRGSDETDLIVTGTNKVTGMFTRLPTPVEDPVERIRVAGIYANQAKAHHHDVEPNLLRAFAEFAPGNTLGAFMRLYADRRLSVLHPPIFNAVISNVAGPAFDMYFLGAKVEAVYPLAPIFHGLGLNITVFSSGDKLNVGLLTCADLTPDIWDLCHAFEAQLAELIAAVERDESAAQVGEAMDAVIREAVENAEIDEIAVELHGDDAES
ncbi:wax ester/triacylglycerol synthase family O-acyltransferase [Gordonia iterans]|uniref:Diacylglycerol O-acyltransferase n=1 Tax=Gordonia iterans TaxID=1004901 RepID=A0A2S0KDA9_9ACTN|nr:wax ester/triacylglycerol synthase family O-acyltransferase [Gordonia iterans]AVL99668.1 wax ester/triacylglycerol synthase family O-acyltransferase [Gordonia iterans]